MIDELTIRKAVELLQQAAPGSTVIVFGSCARGEVDEESDLDVLVVEPELTARRKEMVRLRDVLRPLRIPADVLVVSQRTFDDWAEAPGTILFEAAQEGRVFRATSG